MKVFLIIFSVINLYSSELPNCDQILDNTYFKTCYSYEQNSALYSISIIKDTLVDTVNIKKRPSFYADDKLPKEHQVKVSDFDKTGFDKGHLQNDANFDYSDDSLKATYAMSNMTLQYPKTNRVSNKIIEKYTRDQSKIYHDLQVLIIVNYSGNKLNDKIGIPDSYDVILENKDSNYKECFFLKNDNKEYKLNEMKVQCK